MFGMMIDIGPKFTGYHPHPCIYYLKVNVTVVTEYHPHART